VRSVVRQQRQENVSRDVTSHVLLFFARVCHIKKIWFIFLEKMQASFGDTDSCVSLHGLITSRADVKRLQDLLRGVKPQEGELVLSEAQAALERYVAGTSKHGDSQTIGIIAAHVPQQVIEVWSGPGGSAVAPGEGELVDLGTYGPVDLGHGRVQISPDGPHILTAVIDGEILRGTLLGDRFFLGRISGQIGKWVVCE